MRWVNSFRIVSCICVSVVLRFPVASVCFCRKVRDVSSEMKKIARTVSLQPASHWFLA